MMEENETDTGFGGNGANSVAASESSGPKSATEKGTERERERGGKETGGRRGCERKRRKTGTGGGKESSASKFGTNTIRKGTN